MTGEESYELLARHYDAIHDSKPYRKEADRVLAHLDQQMDGAGDQLLGVACGSARHIAEFTHRFACVGLDANAGMLRLARQRVPQARFVQADMRRLPLEEHFDALTCLFGSIGYLRTWAHLERAVERFADSLREGGAFAIESWYPPEAFDEVQRKVRSCEGEDRAITRVAVAHPPEEGTSRIDIEWLIAEEGTRIRHHRETQQMGVFGVEATRDLLAKHGLDARVDEQGLTEERVLFVGQRV